MKKPSEQNGQIEVAKNVLRDDFSDEIKRVLALRVGYLCSNPGCRKATTGPQQDPTKAINIGVSHQVCDLQHEKRCRSETYDELRIGKSETCRAPEVIDLSRW